jgi:hypothetical protein
MERWRGANSVLATKLNNLAHLHPREHMLSEIVLSTDLGTDVLSPAISSSILGNAMGAVHK